jgi:hypothetical protein
VRNTARKNKANGTDVNNWQILVERAHGVPCTILAAFQLEPRGKQTEGNSLEVILMWFSPNGPAVEFAFF